MIIITMVAIITTTTIVKKNESSNPTSILFKHHTPSSAYEVVNCYSSRAFLNLTELLHVVGYPCGVLRSGFSALCTLAEILMSWHLRASNFVIEKKRKTQPIGCYVRQLTLMYNRVPVALGLFHSVVLFVLVGHYCAHH